MMRETTLLQVRSVEQRHTANGSRRSLHVVTESTAVATVRKVARDSLQCPFLSENSAQAWEILDGPDMP
jgi:hypothetical protein